MPLTVNLRHLEEQNLRLAGELSIEELDIETHDEMIRLEQPLGYELEVQKLEGGLLVSGRLKVALECQCVRCLEAFQYQLELPDWKRHLPLEGEEAARVVNDCVDLTPYVREDILLEFPQHPLCDAECQGLPKDEMGKPNSPNSAGQNQPEMSAWAELNKLKF